MRFIRPSGGKYNWKCSPPSDRLNMSTAPMSDVPLNDEPAAPLPPPAGPRWFQRLSSVLFVVFCFELGLFLLVYPWTDSWAENYFSAAVPDAAIMVWREWWNNP